jgi:NitT/TauT family transport system substrate-binding protein
MEIVKLAFVALVCLTLASCGAPSGGMRVRLALQPVSTNNYPSYLAQWLGFYRAEGVEVSISQIAGASKVLEAVIGGSADVGGGVYEQTIQMAAEGREVVSFISFLRSPNFALAALPERVKSIADLRGKTVGVTSPGSPSQFYLNRILKSAGMQATDVSTVTAGVASTAVAALEHRQVDAAMLFGSSITTLQSRRPDFVMLIDTRSVEGLRKVFGVDNYPASCLLARADWLSANPEAARRMARAVLRSLAWIQEHSPEEILAQVPAESRVGDSAAEIEAIRLAKPLYSLDGRIDPASAEAVRGVLAESLDRVRDAKLDLSKTYSNAYLPAR